MAIHLKSQNVTNMYTPIELVTTNLQHLHFGGGGVTDHGYLVGREDNDHPQYMLTASSSLLALASNVQYLSNSTLSLGASWSNSFIYTSNSSNFIALSNSGAFALSNHTHNVSAFNGAASDHSHGAVNTTTITGTNVTLASASNGLTMGVPNYITTAYGAAIRGSGTHTQNTGTIQFANSNGVTFGLTNGIMTASIPAIGGAQTGISAIQDNAGSSVTNGTIRFVNDGGVSFGLNGSTMSASFSTLNFVNSNGITFGISDGDQLTASFSQSFQTDNPMTFWVGNFDGTTNGDTYSMSTGNLNFYAGSNIELSRDGQDLIIQAGGGPRIGIEEYDIFDVNTLYMVAGANVTLSQQSATTASDYGRVTILAGSGDIPTQTAISGIGALTGGSIYTSGSVFFQPGEAGGIDIGTWTDGLSQYIIFDVNSEIQRTANSIHTHGSFYTTSTSGTNVKLTSVSSGVTMAMPNYITTYNQTGTFAGTGFTSASTSGTDMLGTLNSLGLNLLIPKYGFSTNNALSSHTHGSNISFNNSLITASASSASNGLSIGLTGYEGGDIYFGGGSNITWGSSVSSNSTTIMATAGGGTGTGSIGGIAMEVSGNTTGTMTIMSTGTARLVGGNNITLSQAGNIVTIIGGASQAVNSGFSTGSTSSNLVQGTLNTNGLSLAVPNYLTTAMQSQFTSRFAGTAYSTVATAGSLIGLTVNTSGVTIAVPAYLTTVPTGSIHFVDRPSKSWSSSVSGVNTSVWMI